MLELGAVHFINATCVPKDNSNCVTMNAASDDAKSSVQGHNDISVSVFK